MGTASIFFMHLKRLRSKRRGSQLKYPTFRTQNTFSVPAGVSFNQSKIFTLLYSYELCIFQRLATSEQMLEQNWSPLRPRVEMGLAKLQSVVVLLASK